MLFPAKELGYRNQWKEGGKLLVVKMFSLSYWLALGKVYITED